MRLYLAILATAVLMALGSSHQQSATAVEQDCTRTVTDTQHGLRSYRIVAYQCPLRNGPLRNEAGPQLQHELESMDESYELVSDSETDGVHRMVFKRSTDYQPRSN